MKVPFFSPCGTAVGSRALTLVRPSVWQATMGLEVASSSCTKAHSLYAGAPLQTAGIYTSQFFFSLSGIWQ